MYVMLGAFRIAVVAVLAVGGVLVGGRPAAAATDCVFVQAVNDRTRFVLQDDCTTDATIRIPPGATYDGAGNTITVEDPVVGGFKGAVLEAQGATANVINFRITGELGENCDDGEDRLRGILFDNTSGRIANNRIVDFRQVDPNGDVSGCQEGNSIEARGRGKVVITRNVVVRYQKTGIIVTTGDVEAEIMNNRVEGDGPLRGGIAQNGIQVSFGASAVISRNTIAKNFYTPDTFESCGIILFRQDPVRLRDNTFVGNEVDVCGLRRRDDSARIAASRYSPFEG